MIRPGGIGDAVLLIPTIQVLAASFPQVSIDVLADRRNAAVFELCDKIRRVVQYDQPGQLLRLLGSRYDVIIDVEQWHRLSAVVARLVQSPLKIGYATNERLRLFTHAIPYRHDEYEADSFLRLLEPLGVAPGTVPVGPWLQVPPAAVRVAAALLGACDERPLVVLFPGASIAERRWGSERFREVAQWCNTRGLRVVVVGGGGERSTAEVIVAGLDVLNLAGRTSLAETSAVLSRAAVVISGDSGVLHIAAGLHRPSVSLFGSGIAAKWAPRGTRHIVLNRNLPCSPCTRFGYTPRCPIDARCMQEIAAGEVIAAIATLLAQQADKELS